MATTLPARTAASASTASAQPPRIGHRSRRTAPATAHTSTPSSRRNAENATQVVPDEAGLSAIQALAPEFSKAYRSPLTPPREHENPADAGLSRQGERRDSNP